MYFVQKGVSVGKVEEGKRFEGVLDEWLERLGG